ncbi:hypothetical protein EDB81DRAFT_791627 [Dactylonectria macrodidyma]|uniref:LysM domain-containing protein n=1 Tax=Dactylonectria macrodidyma TaxID=307937 RepID=A0A9P9F675_9HYPO|nr:hypothetical protein EDB81DRAFT_791627 [Dactylonectria macrodidyma]
MGPFQAVRLTAAALFIANGAVLADECQPEVWKLRILGPGEINCRLGTTTGLQVDSNTCASIANKYHITVDTFLDLNPRLGSNCESIQPDTMYCVEGFHEPLRARNGLCGPDNRNATCVGTDKQCCNKMTWRCGNTTDDCTTNCYEGNCY